MNDQIDQYKQQVRKHLSKQEDDDALRISEALCYPSFHPETLLRATCETSGTTFRLVTADSNMWHSGEGVKRQRLKRFQEVASVSPESAQPFWASMDELKPEAIRPGNLFGADGMSVEASYRRGDLLASFETWCPDAATPEGRFVHSLYDLAWKSLKEPTSINRLEQLHGYLKTALPARLVSGDVISLRLFGSLSSYHEQELQKLFNTLPKVSPLVVDMTNFDGMGTLLYPVFVSFASDRPLLAWACSEGAKRHIKAMRMPSAQVFDEKETAIEWAKVKTNCEKNK